MLQTASKLAARPSPFGARSGAAAAPRPAAPSSFAAHAGAAMGRSGSLEAGGAGLGLGRSMSGQLHRARSSSTKCGALATIAEHTGLGKDALLNLVTDPSASLGSFDDVCEALGDVAKVSSALPAAASGLRGLLSSNAAVNWLLEKAAANLHSASLLEGLVDKTLLDLFGQLMAALDLDGTPLDCAPVRIAAAAAIALGVRHALKAHHHAAGTAGSGSSSSSAGAALGARSLSAAPSLSDVLADRAAAAIIAGPAGLPAAQHGASAFSAAASELLGAAACPLSRATVAGRALLASVALGQFKRLNRLKRRALAGGAESVAAGRLSPALLLVAIEGGVLAHNYGELASGLQALLHGLAA